MHVLRSNSANYVLQPEAGLYAIGSGSDLALSGMLFAIEDLAADRGDGPTDTDKTLRRLSAAIGAQAEGAAVVLRDGVAIIARRGLQVGLVRERAIELLDAAHVVVELTPGDMVVLATDGLTEVGPAVAPQALADSVRAAAPDATVLVVAPPASAGARAAGARARALRELFLFEHLTFGERLELQRICGHVSYREGERIVAAGDPGETLYVVAEGRAAVTLGGRRLAVLEPGQHFGEMALADAAPRSADVTALTDCTLISIERDRLLAHAEQNPALGQRVAWRMVQWLAHRTRDLTGQVIMAR